MIKIIVVVGGISTTKYFNDIQKAKAYLDTLGSQESETEEV